MNFSHTSPTMSASASTPAPADPKTVRFQLITPDSPHTTARLPMRVQIYPHDATDSIVTTVKNFYGLYSSPTSSKGVSFEDEAGNTLIARYENFRDKMVVYVRVIEEPAMSPSAFATRNYQSPPALGPSYGSSASHAYQNQNQNQNQNQGQHSPPPSHTYNPHGDANGSPVHPASASASAFASASAHNSAHNSATTSAYFAPVSSLQHFHHLQEHHGEHMHRPGSRTSRKRSLSPAVGHGDRRSTSTNSKNRSRSSRTRATANGNANGGSQHSDGYGPDSMADYSSGDGAPGSNSSRVKEQQPIGNTEISLENIVEGGRRKRAKFESSELPLFAPPQMPAATSNPSVSPTRRSDHRPSLPYVLPGQNPFSGAGALHSPQHYNTHFGQGGVYATPGSDRRHTRASFGYSNAGLVGLGMGMGILPTPDPTVSSLSEEDKDVAMQLMRLGEISNYGRTSTSTQDDTFSGRADAASSTGATSDSESESGGDDGDDYEDVDEEAALLHDASRKHQQHQQRLEFGGASRKIYQSVEPADDDSADTDYKENAPAVSSIPTARAAATSAPSANGLMAAPKTKKVAKAAGNGASKLPRPQTSKAKQPKAPKQPKASGAGGGRSKKAAAAANANANANTVSASAAASAVPMSPASLPPSRKLSVSSVGSGAMSAATAAAIAGMTEEDITDLSSKPRCQRCRKSKKGCDRQRPCGRCRDAGLPADQCVSEDEGNGRKGRYGRHMNIPIKKENGAAIETAPGGAASNGMQPPPPPAMHAHSHSHSHSQSHSYAQSHAHSHVQSQSAIPPPSYHAPAVMPMAQSQSQAQNQAQNQAQTQLPPIQHQHLPQPPLSSQTQAQPIKSLPSLLPPAHISSTPIIAPTIPAMMAASAEKSKKRKR